MRASDKRHRSVHPFKDELEFEKYQNNERNYSNSVAVSIYAIFQQLYGETISTM